MTERDEYTPSLEGCGARADLRMTDIEQEARSYAQRNVGLNVGTIGDRLRAAYIAGASRPAPPATREAVAEVLWPFSVLGGYRTWEGAKASVMEDFSGEVARTYATADALLAAFTIITEKGAE